MNGGFGGGHGLYDLPIFIFSLPWSLIESVLPGPAVSGMNDLLIFIIMPYILNMGLVYGSLLLFRAFRARTNKS